MAHITLPEGLPGITGPTSGERELIATYTSSQNDCYFCQTSHGAAAAHHLGGNTELVDRVKCNFETAPISDKLKALLAIAGQVQKGGKNVTTEHIACARSAGATDIEIHDTVLIAAAFCMYNRYVDGLATWAPHDPAAYTAMGARMAEHGYVNFVPAQPAEQPA